MHTPEELKKKRAALSIITDSVKEHRSNQHLVYEIGQTLDALDHKFESPVKVFTIGNFAKIVSDDEHLGTVTSMAGLFALCYGASQSYELTAVSLHGGLKDSMKALNGIYSLNSTFVTDVMKSIQ
jgi:hypothetical protein